MPFLLFLITLWSQEPPSYKVDAQLVKVPVTVLDRYGKAVLGLSREDFRLLDEGEGRPIENFVLDRSPVHVVFLLDASGSIIEEIEEIKSATLEFAKVFGKEDRIAIISFSDRIEVLQSWTNDQGSLKRSMKKLKRGYRTALYDALFTTAHEKLREVGGKKVIILLTDGLDNESHSTYGAVRNELISSNTVLYIVSRTRLIQSKVEESERVEFLNRVMKNVLKDDRSFVDIYFREKETSMNYLAEVNGGRTFYPERLPALRRSYMQIANELKTQYVLTFRPPENAEEKFRNIEVLCLLPVTQIFHREVYHAP